MGNKAPNWIKDKKKVAIIVIVLIAMIFSSVSSLITVKTVIGGISGVVEAGRGYTLFGAIRAVINNAALDGSGVISDLAGIAREGYFGPATEIEYELRSLQYEIYEEIMDIRSEIR